MTKSNPPGLVLPFKKLTLEWVAVEDHVALLFGRDTWVAIESAALGKGTTAQEMITRAVIYSLGGRVRPGNR